MSIRRYLFLTLVSVLTLITFIAAIQGYKASMARAEKLFEQQLLDFAHIVKDLQKTFENTAAESVAIEQQTNFAFQVWQGSRLIIKSANSPQTPIIALQQDSTTFSEVNFSGRRWRALYLIGLNKTTPLAKRTTSVVIVAQPLTKQLLLAQEVILVAVTPMIIAIVLLSALIYSIITHGLKPLRQLTTALSNKQSNDFTPLKLQVKNSELSNVETTLNQLLARLNLAFERERHFAADAAHELKTPLSVLKINVHNLTQAMTEQEQYRSGTLIKPLSASVDRMRHVIDQILQLNRTNPEQMRAGKVQVKLKPLLQTVISELYQAIAQKQQTITLESDDITLVADELSLQLMLTNLIANANKYSPEHGEIRVAAKCFNSQGNLTYVISIEDSGKGIAEEERNRVFDRFYRIGGDQHDPRVLGCGLGLTIVKHIVDIHGGTITLSQSSTLGGLHVQVSFAQQIPPHLEIAMSGSCDVTI